MITYKSGNILKDPSEAITIPINTVGVMGAGLALQFKRSNIELFRRYKEICEGGALRGGSVLNFKCDNPKATFLFLATKEHWQNPSELEWIKKGLNNMRSIIIDEKINSIAIPALGCGCGGLDWAEVKPIMELSLDSLDAKITIYEPR